MSFNYPPGSMAGYGGPLTPEPEEPAVHVYQIDGVAGWHVCLEAEGGCYQTSDYGPFAEQSTAQMVGEQLLAAWQHDEIRLIDMEDWH